MKNYWLQNSRKLILTIKLDSDLKKEIIPVPRNPTAAEVYKISDVICRAMWWPNGNSQGVFIYAEAVGLNVPLSCSGMPCTGKILSPSRFWGGATYFTAPLSDRYVLEMNRYYHVIDDLVNGYAASGASAVIPTGQNGMSHNHGVTIYHGQVITT